jgi:hypothetical protein
MVGAVKWFEGLVAVCDFLDPWGNAFGLYQVLIGGGSPPRLSGDNRDHRTDIEQHLVREALERAAPTEPG